MSAATAADSAASVAAFLSSSSKFRFEVYHLKNLPSEKLPPLGVPEINGDIGVSIKRAMLSPIDVLYPTKSINPMDMAHLAGSQPILFIVYVSASYTKKNTLQDVYTSLFRGVFFPPVIFICQDANIVVSSPFNAEDLQTLPIRCYAHGQVPATATAFLIDLHRILHIHTFLRHLFGIAGHHVQSSHTSTPAISGTKQFPRFDPSWNIKFDQSAFTFEVPTTHPLHEHWVCAADRTTAAQILATTYKTLVSGGKTMIGVVQFENKVSECENASMFQLIRYVPFKLSQSPDEHQRLMLYFAMCSLHTMSKCGTTPVSTPSPQLANAAAAGLLDYAGLCSFLSSRSPMMMTLFADMRTNGVKHFSTTACGQLVSAKNDAEFKTACDGLLQQYAGTDLLLRTQQNIANLTAQRESMVRELVSDEALNNNLYLVKLKLLPVDDKGKPVMIAGKQISESDMSVKARTRTLVTNRVTSVIRNLFTVKLEQIASDARASGMHTAVPEKQNKFIKQLWAEPVAHACAVGMFHSMVQYTEPFFDSALIFNSPTRRSWFDEGAVRVKRMLSQNAAPIKTFDAGIVSLIGAQWMSRRDILSECISAVNDSLKGAHVADSGTIGSIWSLFERGQAVGTNGSSGGYEDGETTDAEADDGDDARQMKLAQLENPNSVDPKVMTTMLDLLSNSMILQDKCVDKSYFRSKDDYNQLAHEMMEFAKHFPTTNTL